MSKATIKKVMAARNAQAKAAAACAAQNINREVVTSAVSIQRTGRRIAKSVSWIDKLTGERRYGKQMVREVICSVSTRKHTIAPRNEVPVCTNGGRRPNYIWHVGY